MQCTMNKVLLQSGNLPKKDDFLTKTLRRCGNVMRGTQSTNSIDVHPTRDAHLWMDGCVCVLLRSGCVTCG